MRIRPVVAGIVAGAALAAGGLAAVDLATTGAEAQGGKPASQAQLSRLEARLTRIEQNSTAAQRIAKNLQNALGKHVVPEGTLIGAKLPPGVIRQDRGVGAGLPEDVLSAEVRAKLNSAGTAGGTDPAGPPSGAAGGDLSGSYPDPQLAQGSVGPDELGVPLAARLRSGPGTIVPTTTPTRIALEAPGSGGTFDTGGFFTPSAPLDATVPRDGLYSVNTTASMIGTSKVGFRSLNIELWRGNQINTSVDVDELDGDASTPASVTLGGSTLLPAQTGDSFRVRVFQSSGGDLTGFVLNLDVTYIGPLPSA